MSSGGGSSFSQYIPMITAGINAIGNVVGSIWGAKPVPPPVAAPPPPPQPVIYVTAPPQPAKPVEIIKIITEKPWPPPTAAPETLSYLGIIALVLIGVFILACCASGIGFFFWQSQKAERERRDNEMMAHNNASESYMESGRGRGRRGGRGSRSSYSSTGGTRTGRSSYGRSTYGGRSSHGRSRG